MRRKTDAYPAFPEINAQLSYNPARFLVPTDDDVDELPWQTRVKAFIRGMTDVETVRAWIEVEIALGRGPDGGPRKQVITWLNQRQAAIEGRAVSVDETAPPEEESTATALAADGGTDETPICPECHGELQREEIASQIGYWCPGCGEFREPVATEGRT